MKIKSNKNNILCIFCICFAFILIYGTIELSISNGAQLIYSQGYIPPPTFPSPNSIQSQPRQQLQPSQQQQQQSLEPLQSSVQSTKLPLNNRNLICNQTNKQAMIQVQMYR